MAADEERTGRAERRANERIDHSPRQQPEHGASGNRQQRCGNERNNGERVDENEGGGSGRSDALNIGDDLSRPGASDRPTHQSNSADGPDRRGHADAMRRAGSRCLSLLWGQNWVRPGMRSGCGCIGDRRPPPRRGAGGAAAIRVAAEPSCRLAQSPPRGTARRPRTPQAAGSSGRACRHQASLALTVLAVHRFRRSAFGRGVFRGAFGASALAPLVGVRRRDRRLDDRAPVERRRRDSAFRERRRTCWIERLAPDLHIRWGTKPVEDALADLAATVRRRLHEIEILDAALVARKSEKRQATSSFSWARLLRFAAFAGGLGFAFAFASGRPGFRRLWLFGARTASPRRERRARLSPPVFAVDWHPSGCAWAKSLRGCDGRA